MTPAGPVRFPPQAAVTGEEGSGERRVLVSVKGDGTGFIEDTAYWLIKQLSRGNFKTQKVCTCFYVIVTKFYIIFHSIFKEDFQC